MYVPVSAAPLRGLPFRNVAIYRLRRNEPLTPMDLESLEAALREIGNQDGDALLPDLLVRSEAPSLAYFVRKIVGLDREAAKAAFTDFLGDRSLTPAQIRFIETIIDQLPHAESSSPRRSTSRRSRASMLVGRMRCSRPRLR